MRSRYLRCAATFALAIALAACSGAPAGAANDPAGTVTSAFTAAQTGGLLKLDDFACAAQKGKIAQSFGGANMAGLEAAGIKPDDLMSAFTVSFENVTTKEISKTDTTAKVKVTGDMKMTFDKDKLKVIMKTMLGQQGLPTDDATIDTMLTAMAGSLTQTQKIDEEVDVVKEGDKWLICS